MVLWRSRDDGYQSQVSSLESGPTSPGEPPPPLPESLDTGPWQNPPVTSHGHTPSYPSYPDESHFKHRLYFRLGMTQIGIGLVSIAVGITAGLIGAYGAYICVPIWCGMFFAASGMVCVVASIKMADKWISVSFVLCVVSTSIALLPITIGVFAVTQEHFFKPSECDIFDEYPCSSIEARMAIDVLILAAGVCEIFVGLAAACTSNKTVCDCCKLDEDYGVFSSGDNGNSNRNSYNRDNPPMLILPPNYESLVSIDDDRLILLPAVLPRPSKRSRSSRRESGEQSTRSRSNNQEVPTISLQLSSNEAVTSAVRRMLGASTRESGQQDIAVEQSQQSFVQTSTLTEGSEVTNLQTEMDGLDSSSCNSLSTHDYLPSTSSTSDDCNDTKLEQSSEQTTDLEPESNNQTQHVHSDAFVTPVDGIQDFKPSSDMWRSAPSSPSCYERECRSQRSERYDNDNDFDDRESNFADAPPSYEEALGHSHYDCHNVRNLDDNMGAFLLDEQELQ